MDFSLMGFQFNARQEYYEVFSRAAKRNGLGLDRYNYKKVVLKKKEGIIAVVDSDCQIANPENFFCGEEDNRKYGNLEISVVDSEWLDATEGIGDFIGYFFKQRVSVQDKSSQKEQIVDAIQHPKGYKPVIEKGLTSVVIGG